MRTAFGSMALAIVAAASVGSTAHAANYLNTFDTSADPFRVDYFSGTTGTPTVTFDAAHNLGGPAGSGSAKFSENPTGAANGVAFTADVIYPATTSYGISFDLLVDPASAFGASNHGAGYFQVFTRLTDNYNTVDTGYAENLGNPGYSGTPQYGIWEHINIPLDPATTGNGVRAITIQNYNNDNITGNVTFYVDNLVLTTTPPGAPEPATLGLCGVAAAMMLRRVRR